MLGNESIRHALLLACSTYVLSEPVTYLFTAVIHESRSLLELACFHSTQLHHFTNQPVDSQSFQWNDVAANPTKQIVSASYLDIKHTSMSNYFEDVVFVQMYAAFNTQTNI